MGPICCSNKTIEAKCEAKKSTRDSVTLKGFIWLPQVDFLLFLRQKISVKNTISCLCRYFYQRVDEQDTDTGTNGEKGRPVID